MITKQDFDKAVSGPFNSETCLIAQKVMRETGKIVKFGGMSGMTMMDDTDCVLSYQDRRMQSFFDMSYSSSCLSPEEKESNLFFLRAFLPLEDKDI